MRTTPTCARFSHPTCVISLCFKVLRSFGHFLRPHVCFSLAVLLHLLSSFMHPFCIFSFHFLLNISNSSLFFWTRILLAFLLRCFFLVVRACPKVIVAPFLPFANCCLPLGFLLHRSIVICTTCVVFFHTGFHCALSCARAAMVICGICTCCSLLGASAHCIMAVVSWDACSLPGCFTRFQLYTRHCFVLDCPSSASRSQLSIFLSVHSSVVFSSRRGNFALSCAAPPCFLELAASCHWVCFLHKAFLVSFSSKCLAAL